MGWFVSFLLMIGFIASKNTDVLIASGLFAIAGDISYVASNLKKNIDISKK